MAGIGMIVAARNAATLQNVVANTDTPLFLNTSPTWS